MQCSHWPAEGRAGVERHESVRRFSKNVRRRLAVDFLAINAFEQAAARGAVLGVPGKSIDEHVGINEERRAVGDVVERHDRRDIRNLVLGRVQPVR